MKMTLKSSARLAIAAGLCLAAAGAPALAQDAWADPTSVVRAANAKAYETGDTFTVDGVTYKVLGTCGDDFNESDAGELLISKGDVVVEILKVDSSAVVDGIHELSTWVQMVEQGDNFSVYKVADNAFVGSGAKHVLLSFPVHMDKAALPAGVDVIVPNEDVLEYEKFLNGVDPVGYELSLAKLDFSQGIDSGSKKLEMTVIKSEDMTLDVSVDDPAVVQLTQGSDGAYTVAPVACGSATITAKLMLGDYELVKKKVSANVSHVEGEGVVETEPSYTQPGCKVFTCKHCGEFIRSETINKLGIGYFEEGGVAYNQVGEGIVEVVKSGTSSFTNPLYANVDVVVPAQVVKDGVTYKVAGIADYAFDPLTSASPKSITIAEGVEYIGDGAFQSGGDGATTMLLDALVIPKSVKSVGDNAFQGTTIKSLTFAPRNGAELTFGDGAFSNFSTEGGKLELPEGTTALGSNLFATQPTFAKLNSIKLSNTVKITNRHTFTNVDLDIIDFPEGYAEKDGVFYGNGVALWPTDPNATKLVIAPGTKDIADFAFSEMANLESVQLPEGLECVGDRAFSNCGKLTALELPESVTHVRDNPRGGTGWLNGCTSLKSFSAPGLEKTAFRMFDDCAALESVELPAVKHVSFGSFTDTKLSTIVLPGVETIEGRAFGSGQTVIFTSENPPTLADGKLPDDVTVWYPESVADKYEQALGVTPGGEDTETAFGIEVSGALSFVEGGAAAKLPVTITKGDEMAVTYTVADEAVAAVSADGTVMPKNAGTTAVTVSIKMGEAVLTSADVPVTVAHAFGEAWHSDASGHWHECACGAKDEVSVHEFGAWKTVKEPTATAKGSAERVCPICGFTETKELPALGEAEKPGSGDTGKPGDKNPDGDKEPSGDKLPTTGDPALMVTSLTAIGAAASLGAGSALRRREGDAE